MPRTTTAPTASARTASARTTTARIATARVATARVATARSNSAPTVRDRSVPSGSTPVATALSRGLLAPVVRLVWRPRVIGRRNGPRRGPVILAANHRSFVDSPAITLLAPRRVSFLAKEEYFTGTGVRGAVSRWFFGAIGAIGVRRGAGAAAQEALALGLARLDAGEAFAIYPEGTRSLDGRLYRGRTGVAWLALTSGAPVVPVALTGTEDVQPVGSRFPRRARVTVEFGEPWTSVSSATRPRGRRVGRRRMP